MRKLMHLTAGIAFVTLAVLLLIKAPASTTGAVLSKHPETISVEDLQRSIDLNALPVRDVKEEPF